MNITSIPSPKFGALYIKGENIDRLQVLAKDLEYMKAMKSAPAKALTTSEIDQDSFDIAYGEKVEIDPQTYAAQHFQDEYILKKKMSAKPDETQTLDAIEKIKTQQKVPPRPRKLDIKA